MLANLATRNALYDSLDEYEPRPDLPVEEGTILVVDDEPRAAEFMRHLIERDGFARVVTAGDGRSALELMSDYPPDIVVLDVHLPNIDGYTVLREIVRNDTRRGFPTGVLAVSGDASAATEQSMLWAGADDFLARPFAGAEFARRVRQLANRTAELRRALVHVQFLDGGP